MCMDDWRLGRLVKPRLVTPASLSNATYPADPQRVGLIFTAADLTESGSTASCHVIFNPNADTGGELYINPNNSPFVCSFVNCGLLPSMTFTVFVPAAGVAYAITGLYMPEDYIQAGLEEFIREFNSWKGKR